MEKVSLIGLGKLGLSLAATIAASGRSVLGIDIDDEVVRKVNEGRAPLPEPGLEEMLSQTAGSTLEATTDVTRAVSETDYTIILVQTPSESDGRYGLRALRGVLEALCREIKAKNKLGHLISVNSTIQPGSMDNEIIPYIERATGMTEGEDIFVCYNPEMVALGTTIKNFQYPDFILVGGNSAEGLARVSRLQNSVICNDAPVKAMSAVSAEIVKISLNTYLTVKISFANLISQLATQLPGAEIDLITGAIGADDRIGGKFLKAGNSFGGTCFPRDVNAFRCFMEDTSVPTSLANAIAEINKRQSDALVATVLDQLAAKGKEKVVILGLSFKPDTHVIAESSAISLVTELLERNVQVSVYDPFALPAAKDLFGYALQYASSAADAIVEDAVVVMYNDVAEYRKAICAGVSGNVVIDCWRALDPASLPDDTVHVAMGDGPK